MLYAKSALIESKVHFLQITSLFTFCTTRSQDALYFSIPRECIFLREERSNKSPNALAYPGVPRFPLNWWAWNAESLVAPLRNGMGAMSYSHSSSSFIKCTPNKAPVMIFSGQITADACCVTARRCTSPDCCRSWWRVKSVCKGIQNSKIKPSAFS